MSYTLELYFERPVVRRSIDQYFANRRHFRVSGNTIGYGNPDTEVHFSFHIRSSRNLLLRKVVRYAEFEVNYFRPSHFGLEAEIELSAFMATFRPRIFDPQIRGMGEGPYSREGFLRGWDFGNQVSIYQVLSADRDRKIWAMPANKLNAIWEWNYQSADRQKILKNRRHLQSTMFITVEGRPSRAIIWSHGAPVSLPEVDYVLLMRPVADGYRFGLVPWSEVLDVVQRAGLDTSKVPLDLQYRVTPKPIEKWFADIPLADPSAFTRLHTYEVLDTELIAAAHESIAIGEIDGAITINPPPRAAVAV